MRILIKSAKKKYIIIPLIVIIFALIPTVVLANFPPNFLVGMLGIYHSHVYIGMSGVANSNLWMGMQSLEGSSMTANSTFIGLILMGIVGSFFAIYKRQILFAIGASVIWFLLIAFTRANPIATIGGSSDSLFIGACVSFSVATMLTTFIMRNSDEKEKVEKFRNSPNYRSEQDINRNNSQGSSYESADDYQARLARTSRRKRN